MPLSVRRRALDVSLSAPQVLRALRDHAGLFGLLGEWSAAQAVIGFDPVQRLRADEDPFAAIAGLPSARGDGAFGGGWVGVLGFRLAHRLERLPASPPRPIPRPDVSLARYDHVLVRDGAGWWLESLTDDDGSSTDRFDELFARVRADLTAGDDGEREFRVAPMRSTPDEERHLAAVERTLEHLVAGDIFQANVCRRLEGRFDGDPLDLFCAGVEWLAPLYSAFVRTEGGAVASFSPELFLRRIGRSVRTSPIKGTAPLDSDVSELVTSTKNRAENVMIVDLMRNDLGRVCVPGSVRVAELVRAEKHTGVWHLVSDVVGELADGVDDAALLRATFPPGSVTGAPKVRAVEVIHEVEATGREAYTGAIGYVSPVAGMELNVAIRTLEFAAGRVWLGVGGGVVADSTPEGELAETMVKAAPLLAAVGATLERGGRSDVLSPAARASADRTAWIPDAARDSPAVDPARGVFTTMLVEDGVPSQLDQHLARLAASVCDCFDGSLPDDVTEVVRRACATLVGRWRLRLSWAPGARAAEVELRPIGVADPTPLRLTPVLVPGGLGQHKLADRRRLEAAQRDDLRWSGNHDTLLVDVDGAVLETGRGNVFVVTDGEVRTAELDGRLLPGITRQLVVDRLAHHGIEVVRCGPLTCADFDAANEVFATSSLDGVRPVGRIDAVGVWPPGPTTTWLRGALRRPSPPVTIANVAPHRRRPRLLVLDNYDSFVYNLDQQLRELGATTQVARNDAVSVDDIERLVAAGEVDGLVISPGPGRPAGAGIGTEAVRRLGPALPILGVCLGHQCIAEAYGARVVRAERVVHGKPSLVHHDGTGVFAGLDGPLLAGRYHSLVVDEATLPEALEVSARSGNGLVMGLRHRVHPVEGVQIHPESILTPAGHVIVANFVAMADAHR